MWLKMGEGGVGELMGEVYEKMMDEELDGREMIREKVGVEEGVDG